MMLFSRKPVGPIFAASKVKRSSRMMLNEYELCICSGDFAFVFDFVCRSRFTGCHWYCVR